MSENILYGYVRSTAVTYLKLISEPSAKDFQDKVALALKQGKEAGLPGEVDASLLVNELMCAFNFYFDGSPVIMEDPRDHVPWLPEQKTQIKWNFWERYRLFLEKGKQRPPKIVDGLDSLTDLVLERLEFPKRPPNWDTRGMVVGSVQAGKTEHYIGVISKAIDAGYKLIIVLSGLTNDLRSQTQYRVDEGILGIDTSKKARKVSSTNSRIGVRAVAQEEVRPNWDNLEILPITSGGESGDFRRSFAERTCIPLGGAPVIAVLKKNSLVLKNLLEWICYVKGENNSEGKKVVKDIPLLLIDDEADNASINVSEAADGETGGEVSAINRRIREILSTFSKSAYVGYTATPYANVFIDPDVQHDNLGDDIYPRNFIITLKSPNNYVGPDKVFGYDEDSDAGIIGAAALPVVRTIDDWDRIFPVKHKKDLSPKELPPSLSRAIRVFILSCAARTARGEVYTHKSMLVHVTRFVDVQEDVARLVQEELDAVRRRIKNGDGRGPSIIDELKNIWKEEFAGNAGKFPKDLNIPDTSWAAVRAALPASTAKIRVREINGRAGDVLEYAEHKKHGISLIAVGGDKLSRGITLEGLSVSYYLRFTKMADTLLQMGRWFGYRDNYIDLCRLYTTEDLVKWYRHVALTEYEARRELDYMRTAKLTPAEYGVKIRQSPDGMLITALNKMRHGKEMKLSFSGQLAHTTHFTAERSALEKNESYLRNFIRSLGKEDEGPSQRYFKWDSVDHSHILKLLGIVNVNEYSFRANPKRLADYISAQVGKGELTNWTVALYSKKDSSCRIDFEKFSAGAITRAGDIDVAGVYHLNKDRLGNQGDQTLDLTDIECSPKLVKLISEKRSLLGYRDLISGFGGGSLYEMVRFLTSEGAKRGLIRGDGKTPNDWIARQVRPVENGLLSIYLIDPAPAKLPSTCPPFVGFEISFPGSNTAREVTYVIGEKFIDQIDQDIN